MTNTVCNAVTHTVTPDVTYGATHGVRTTVQNQNQNQTLVKHFSGISGSDQTQVTVTYGDWSWIR